MMSLSPFLTPLSHYAYFSSSRGADIRAFGGDEKQLSGKHSERLCFSQAANGSKDSSSCSYTCAIND